MQYMYLTQQIIGSYTTVGVDEKAMGLLLSRERVQRLGAMRAQGVHIPENAEGEGDWLYERFFEGNTDAARTGACDGIGVA